MDTVEQHETETRNNIGNWYQRIPAGDRDVIDAAARWLRPVKWQWFVTLTFPWNVRAETADRKLKQLINSLEKGLRASICFVAGKESKPKVNGMNVPWHFQLLMTSHVPIPRQHIEFWWVKEAGEGKVSFVDGKSVPETVKVEPYNENEKGPEYCLKSMNDCFGDWLFRRLEHFHPGIPGSSRPNHRKLRAAKRAQAQAERVAAERVMSERESFYRALNLPVPQINRPDVQMRAVGSR
jgi:hypothetical protein